jgi:hypothetical protein
MRRETGAGFLRRFALLLAALACLGGSAVEPLVHALAPDRSAQSLSAASGGGGQERGGGGHDHTGCAVCLGLGTSSLPAATPSFLTPLRFSPAAIQAAPRAQRVVRASLIRARSPPLL